MVTSRSLKWIVPLLALLVGAAARADKPVKIPVAMGTWNGPHAGTFKSAVRSGMSKDCVVTKAAKARVTVDGEVTEEEKGFKVRVVVKSPKTNDIVESREYSFAKPTVSSGMAKKMGHDVGEIAKRAPE
jgi:hypothetical protein